MLILNYWWQLLLFGIAIYLISNVNYAIILTKIFKKQDIRKVGSGNPGTTNTLRCFGFGLGLAVFVCDAIKGVCAVAIGLWLFPWVVGNDTIGLFASYFFSLCSVLGHVFPVFLKFHGGKGFASSIGLFSMLNPIFSLGGLIVGFALLLLTDFMSLFAMFYVTLQFAFAGLILFTNASLISEIAVGSFVCAGLIWAIVIFSHRQNIVRLIKGKENPSRVREMLFKRKKTENN